MPTTGAYEFRLAAKAVDGVVTDDHLAWIEIGEWAWVDQVGGSARQLMFRCPDCWEFGTLRQAGGGHSIDAQGNVSPSVSHSWKYGGIEQCGFHTWPTRLLGFVDKGKRP